MLVLNRYATRTSFGGTEKILAKMLCSSGQEMLVAMGTFVLAPPWGTENINSVIGSGSGNTSCAFFIFLACDFDALRFLDVTT